MNKIYRNRWSEIVAVVAALILPFVITAAYYLTDYAAANIFFTAFGVLIMGIVANVWAGTLTTPRNTKKEGIIVDVVRQGSTALIAYMLLSYLLLYLILFSPMLQYIGVTGVKVFYYVVAGFVLLVIGFCRFRVLKIVRNSHLA